MLKNLKNILMNIEDLTYRIAFSQIRGNNRIIAEELLLKIGNEKEFFNAPSRIIEMQIGKKSKIAEDSYRKQILEKAKQKGDRLC